MLFRKSNKPKNQEAQGAVNAPQQTSYPNNGAQNAFGGAGAPQGYGAQAGYGQNPPAAPAGYGAENRASYTTPAVGGGYFGQGTAPQSYPGQLGQNSAGMYPQGNQPYPQGGGYPQSSGGYPQGSGGYPQSSAGYPQGSAGYPQGSGGYPQGSAGYPQSGQAAGYPQGFSRTGGQSAYPMNSQGYPQMNPQGGYPQGGYPQMNPQGGYQSQGYPPQGGQAFAGYPQMGRTAQNAPEAQSRQIPLNGGGYVPPARKVRRPFEFKNLYLLILSVVLLALFVVGIAAFRPLLWVFAPLALASVAFFWIRPSIDTNKRLCFTIVFVALTVVAGVTLFAGASSDPTKTPGGATTAAPGNQTSSGGTIVDPKTGQVLVTVGVAPETATPVPRADDHSATDRLESFFYYWSVNKQDDMLTLCAPSWLSTVDNAKTALFGLMANRTPLDYTVEKISGTVDDTSRTVTVTSTMDRNNGKAPVKYRLGVLMVREGEQWYVDPQSLKSYEEAETQDPATAATPTPTVEPAANSSTILYYNPDGGSKYHLDQNCKSTHAKYLPMKGHFTYGEINDPAYKNLEPCNVCAAPLRP